MSVYNHRPMVPAPQNRIVEMLDAIRVEFEQLAHEAYACKSQRDDFEQKMNAQIQEMNNFQQSLLELERSQQALKKHYEEEIARLRQQLEQAQARSGQQPQTAPRPASAAPPNAAPPPEHHPPAAGGPPPPIGPGSGYFGGIMNAQQHGSSNNSSQSNLGPPTQMLDQSPQYPGYAHSHPPTSGPPQTQGPPPPPMNGSPNMPLPPPPGAPAMYGGRMPTSPSPGPYPRHIPPENGAYGYPSRSGGPPGTPSSQPGHLPGADAQAAEKRKSTSMPGLGVMTHRSSGSISKMGGPPPAVPPGALADVDPESVPANMKIEGQDWFALFNPKVPRYVNVNLVHTLEHTSVVCCVKFSMDGRYLAAGCNRSTFIYEVATGRQICVLQDDSALKEGDLYIRSVCFSPDGMYLATGAEDKKIRVWDITNRRVRQCFIGHEQDIYSLDYSRDGRIIASGSGDRTVRIWSLVEGKCAHVLQITDLEQKDPGVTSVAISPDGRLVAAGSLDKMVRVWDVQTGEALERLEGHKDSVYSVAFMPDGRTLISGSLDKTLKLWQLGTHEGRGYGIERDRSRGPCKMTFTGHKDFVLSVACTPDGRWIVSGSKDRGVQFWDPRTGQTQFMLQGHRNSVISVAISPHGRPVFATGSGDNRARIWSYDNIV